MNGPEWRVAEGEIVFICEGWVVAVGGPGGWLIQGNVAQLSAVAGILATHDTE